MSADALHHPPYYPVTNRLDPHAHPTALLSHTYAYIRIITTPRDHLSEHLLEASTTRYRAKSHHTP